ncbi:MAG: 4Fe-4S binding protein [Erysipelotrichaceae bacterium]|nr:4Fe-4S binding protein [Erysipelotrichaceae bacterium]
MNKMISVLRKRSLIQFLSTLLTNIHLPNFLKGTLYTGDGKKLCVPGLNCYSCPGAAGSCPIGSFQAVAGSSKFKFSYYITGLLILFGSVFGRLICGFLCPFGWFQDLLHKIPFKKLSTKKLKFLTYIKYVMLVVVVCILPVVFTNPAGIGSPYFCKYICPQGILEGGIPLAVSNPAIRSVLGPLFLSKAAILAAVVILAIIFYRPFCKWICPLGAFYALFNKISFYQYHVDEKKCISCGKCSRACKMDVDITKNAAATECIRCGECKKACPAQAISSSFRTFRSEQAASSEKTV